MSIGEQNALQITGGREWTDRLRIISQLDFHDRPVRIVQKNPVPHVKQFGAEKGGLICVDIWLFVFQ
jgi:hypothetical protein